MGTEVPMDDLVKMSEGARIAGSLPYITDEITKMENAILARLTRSVEDGTLTKEEAYLGVVELHSSRKLLRKLTTRTKMGVSAGERIAPGMSA